MGLPARADGFSRSGLCQSPLAGSRVSRPPRNAAVLGQRGSINPKPFLSLERKNFRRSTKVKAAESITEDAECCEAEGERPPFDLNLAVLLAGFAFECYNDPLVSSETLQETDTGGCTTTYLSNQFVLERYTGQLQVKMLCATNCPALDLWGTSDPYAVVQVGSRSARTKTAWTTKEPVWKEDLALMVRASEGEALESEYLRVSLWDAGIIIAPRRMGSAAIPLAGLCDGTRHECNLKMDGPGGGATVYFEVQYKSFEQLAEEERKRWRLPSVADILPPQLLEAAAVSEQMLSSLLPFLSSSGSSPTISSSDFVRSALQAFDAPFPGSIDKLRDSSREGVDLSPLGGQGPKVPEETVEPAQQTPASPGMWALADTARSALESAGWWGGGKASTTEDSAKGSQVVAPEGCIDLQNAPGVELPGLPGGEGPTGKASQSEGGRLSTVDVTSLLPPLSTRRRKQDLKQELIDAGLALPEDADGGGGRAEDDGGKESAALGLDSSFSELKQAVFAQTESLLGWMAVLGASKEAAQSEAGSSSPAQAPAGEEGGDGAEESEIEEAAMTEEQRQAMKDVFGRAETAVEAWAMLASSLGQQTFVKSDYEKIAFIENKENETQLAVWRDVPGRRLVVSFRGTEQTKLKDLLTDIALAPAGLNPERASGGSFKEEPMVHTGFLSAYDSVRARVVALLKDLTDAGVGEDDQVPWHLFITGHSLGGALATLLADELSSSRFIRERQVRLTMYNYGSPRVGNSVFADKYNTKVQDSWRVVNHRDIIPTVPRLMGYRHVCCPVYLNPLPPGASPTASEARALAGGGTSPQEEDGYLGDVIGEKTTDDLVNEFLGGEQNMWDRLIQTEIAMLNALRDGSAISMHMEDFYYVALLKKVQSGGSS